MGEDNPFQAYQPRNWCFDCGKPIWDYSRPRRAESLLGPVVLCQECATRHPGNVPATEPGQLIGWKHKQRMTRVARRKGKN